MRIPGTNLHINRAHARSAGQARVSHSSELIAELRNMTTGEIAGLLSQGGSSGQRQFPIMGGSAQVLTVTTSPTALGASLTTYIGPLVGLVQAPLVIAFHMCPTITGATAAATITFNMRRTDTPAVISSLSFLTATADTNPRGPTMFGLVPFGIPATSGIDVQASASTGAGTLTASATAPLILAALGIQ